MSSEKPFPSYSELNSKEGCTNLTLIKDSYVLSDNPVKKKSIFIDSATYLKCLEEGKIKNPGMAKLHVCLERSEENMAKAFECLMKNVLPKFNDLALRFKVEKTNSSMRPGAEMTFLIFGNTNFSLNIAAAKRWLEFSDCIKENFMEAKIKAGKKTPTDKQINRYVSYRLGPTNTAEPGELYDFTGKKIQAAEDLSYKDVRNKSVENKNHNPNKLEDFIHLASLVKKNQSHTEGVKTRNNLIRE